MPEFRPFPGIRYRTDDLDAVTAPPYDVIDPEPREALMARSEHNAVRLILPGEGDGYERAAGLIRDWLESGLLGRDDAPTFYSYRMQYTDDLGVARRTVGVLGGLVMPRASGEGDVLPHERTLPKAKSDRLALLRATRVNLDPIWGLTPATGLSDVASRAVPLARTTDEDGVVHELGAITAAEDIARIEELVAQEPVVLADGHHRFETAIAYREERRAAGIVEAGDDAIMCLIVELTDEQLWVQPIHRLIDGVSSPTGLRLKLGTRFRIVDATANTPEALRHMMTKVRTEGGVALVDGEGLARLVPDADDLETARGTIEPELADVPTAWFDAVAGDALAGLDITYRHDAQAIAAMVDAGSVDAAILLAPVTVDQIRAAAKARVRMPQKTTFFAPKPRTGLVFRSLDAR